MTEAHAFWITAPREGAIRKETLSPAGPDQISVRALHSAVSRGTEGLVFRCEVPTSEQGRMRAPFQSGDFPAPVKYGYASVGRVEKGPPHLEGKTVFCLYPHQTRYVVPASAVQVVPDGVPAGRAVLAANLETALNGIWDAGVQPGDRVAVIGAGVVGSLVAWLATRIAGCEVLLIDVNPLRAAVADAFHAGFASPDQALAAWPQKADHVIHASGSPQGLNLALKLAAVEATITEMSWYGTRDVALPLGEAFHALRLVLRSSQVGSLPASHRARWSHGRRLALALKLLAAPELDVLINSEGDFADLPALMPLLFAPESNVLCHRVNYR